MHVALPFIYHDHRKLLYHVYYMQSVSFSEPKNVQISKGINLPFPSERNHYIWPLEYNIGWQNRKKILGNTLASITHIFNTYRSKHIQNEEKVTEGYMFRLPMYSV